ncbi:MULTISPECIES: hypothetical protein [unclassified Paenibacillus]|uniref:hypothetical protein n=1 Tax=unclassified Paenibacillus TaxID=185978 RepID=UPI00278242FB|nr:MULTISPECIES: hypothetical protein [unclassified Paenibacillus]MDQ0897076.1 hypothetical protein [Paenibacillus sp. V4I7]MDQ0916774.1 hypothetical protein [Paenibacillus sp. V4I5]
MEKVSEGLLLRSNDTAIYVTAIQENSLEVERIFERLLIKYPSSLIIKISDDMVWINENIPVHVWIVPYVGLESAIQFQTPYILCLHDLVYLHFKELYYALYPDFCYRLDGIVHNVVGNAAAVVFPSNHIRNTDGLNHLTLNMKKTKVIRLTAPVEEYASYFSIYSSVSA